MDALTTPERLAELHDARIESICARPAGVVLLQFTSLSVFEKQAPDRYRVELYSAELELRGVQALSVTGAERGILAEEQSFVMDGALHEGATELHMIPCDQTQHCTGVTLARDDGTRISVECQAATLRLRSHIRHLEEWIGPLSSTAVDVT